jgi:hypothetical protein
LGPYGLGVNAGAWDHPMFFITGVTDSYQFCITATISFPM